MLTPAKKVLIRECLCSLVETQTAAVAEIQEKISVLLRELGLNDEDNAESKSDERPKADVATFSVEWHGRSCFLGNTLLFWLFDRLAQSPNCYVSNVDLLDDVWRGEREDSTIRGVAKRLRDRLCAAGMTDLAAAIDGSVPGYYGLMLV